MGYEVAIDYSELKDAASEAKQVARKLDKYADNLNSQIYRKLNSYSGTHTTNVTSAMTSVNSKIIDLRARADAYETYSTDISDLKTECETVDKSVRTKVSTLTATFKSNHGIKNSKVENFINYHLTSWGNSNKAFRWLGNKLDDADAGLKQWIQDKAVWWNYEGGKELVKGVAIGVLEVVVAVAAIVGAIAAIISGGWTIALAAALIGGIIAAVNGVNNVINEIKAYDTTKNGDPATGRRRSKIDTIQDWLRSSFVYGADGESYRYDPTKYNAALAIDVVKTVCDVIGIVDSVGKLTKNLYKWTTGSTADPKNLRIKDILTKENIGSFKDKVKLSFSDGFENVKSTIHAKDFTKMKSFAADFGSDFMNNLKDGLKESFTFDKSSWTDKAKTVKNISAVVKSWGGLGKDVLKFESGGDAIKYVVKEFGYKNLPGFGEIVTYDGSNRGVFAYKFEDFKMNDFTSILEKGSGTGKSILNLFSKGPSAVDIKIPEINIPDIKIAPMPTINVNINTNVNTNFNFNYQTA